MERGTWFVVPARPCGKEGWEEVGKIEGGRLDSGDAKGSLKEEDDVLGRVREEGSWKSVVRCVCAVVWRGVTSEEAEDDEVEDASFSLLSMEGDMVGWTEGGA